jgi:hypothetical protein
MTLDRTGPCLCCNKPVAFSSEEAAQIEDAAHVCQQCYTLIYFGFIPWGIVKVLYSTKKELFHLSSDMEIMKRNIHSLYQAQQDVEQAILAST